MFSSYDIETEVFTKVCNATGAETKKNNKTFREPEWEDVNFIFAVILQGGKKSITTM